MLVRLLLWLRLCDRSARFRSLRVSTQLVSQSKQQAQHQPDQPRTPLCSPLSIVPPRANGGPIEAQTEAQQSREAQRPRSARKKKDADDDGRRCHPSPPVAGSAWIDVPREHRSVAASLMALCPRRQIRRAPPRDPPPPPFLCASPPPVHPSPTSIHASSARWFLSDPPRIVVRRREEDAHHQMYAPATSAAKGASRASVVSCAMTHLCGFVSCVVHCLLQMNRSPPLSIRRLWASCRCDRSSAPRCCCRSRLTQHPPPPPLPLLLLLLPVWSCMARW